LLALSEHVLRTSEHPALPEVRLADRALKPTRELKGGAREYAIPISELAGQSQVLSLETTAQRQVAFSLSAAYKLNRPATSTAPTFDATSGENGPNLYRVFTTPEGAPVDLQKIKAGELVRVALLAERPKASSSSALAYLAISDALPAGFEAVDASLDTVRGGPAADARHPWYSQLLSSPRADHIELGDAIVNIYFDHPRRTKVATSYLVRATNPGRFQLSPARAELMYEAYSTSYTEADTVVVR
jgi:uncharacterized protein YfaS (alpha-2-macroglobulin family)